MPGTNNRKYDIFISYRHNEGGYFVEYLYSELTHSGYSVFMDSAKLIPGENYDRELLEVIDNCNDFILILSPHALDNCMKEGDWIVREVERASDKQKNIIPIKLNGFEMPEAVPDSLQFLEKRHWLKEPPREYYTSLLDKLSKAFVSQPVTESKKKKKGWLISIFVIVLLCIGWAFYHKDPFNFAKKLNGFQSEFANQQQAETPLSIEAMPTITITPKPAVIIAQRNDAMSTVQAIEFQATTAWQQAVETQVQRVLGRRTAYASASISVYETEYAINYAAAKTQIAFSEIQTKTAEPTVSNTSLPTGISEGTAVINSDELTELGIRAFENKDYKKALEYFNPAADAGNAKAQNYLGYMYQNGYGVTRYYEKALEYYQKAAEQGYAEAQNHLGDIYFYDKGEFEQAREWYEKAAEQGHADAQCNLGDMYYFGIGGEQSYPKAEEWYQKAADQGNAIAMENLLYLKRRELNDAGRAEMKE